jgi:hypothetical protein
MSQRTDKYKSCPLCKTGKIRTDEIGRKYNAEVDGKPVCANCKVNSIMAKFGARPNMEK